MTRICLLIVAAALAAGACAGGEDDRPSGSGSDGEGAPQAVAQVPGGPREDTPSALDNPGDGRLPPALIEVEQLQPGGPPPDGIPSIDEPRFLRPADVTFLADREPVLALAIGGDARGLPAADHDLA